MEYYSAIKNMKSSSFATAWMDIEGIRISEINKTKKDNSRISLMYGI